MTVQNLTVTEDEGEQRLDKWLRRRFPQLNQVAVEKLCRTGQLRVDSGRVKASDHVKPGQTVRVPPLPDQVARTEARIQGVSAADGEAVMEMVVYLTDLAEKKLADPSDDVVSLLVTSEIDGSRVSPAELLTFIMSLVVAGNETTRHLMSGSFIELAARPDQRAALYAAPDRIPDAVEECLRLYGTVNIARE